MTNTNKGLVSLYISLFTLILFFNGCEDPGNVGSSFIDEPTIKIDTLYLDDITTESLEAFSGNLATFNIGLYSDQIFGDVKATGLVKPSLYQNASNINANDFTLSLEIQLDSTITYGDTTSQASFTLYEINTLWRGNAQFVNSTVTYDESSSIGSFTVGEEKRFSIELSDDWRDKYAGYLNNTDGNADSLYRYEFFGLAIVPDNSANKISVVDVVDSRFILVDAEDDTVSLGMSSQGYFLERTNVNTSDPTVTHLYSTLERMMRISLPVEELEQNYKGTNLLAVDLVLHEVDQLLSASLPANHTRPTVNLLTANLREESEQVYEYQINGPDFFANKNDEDPYYRANITTYLNNLFFGAENNNELLIGLSSGSGILRSTLIHNQYASQELRPKLIITTAVNEEN